MRYDYIINGRFYIDVSRNLILEKENDNKIRIEPRIMKLLCMLLENTGRVVNRQTIVSEIWDDYGSADDGLTQGISFLRKVFGDEKKELIVTIPKRGYVIEAEISKKSEPNLGKSGLRSFRQYIVGLGAIVVLVAFYIMFSSKTENNNPDQFDFSKGQKRDTLTIQKQDSDSIQSSDDKVRQ